MDTPPAEIAIDAALVARLVQAQHPSFAGRVRWVSSGWDNELFRLGEDWVVRMPRRAVAAPLVLNERRWLPVLQALVEPPLPVPVAVGVPSDEFPWHWSIVRWLPGVPAAFVAVSERGGLVAPLADFVRALHVPAPVDAPVNPVRGTPLAARDAAVRARLASDAIPHASALLSIWHRALAAPRYDGPPLWMHGDLHPLNVLLAPWGALSAVVDFGDLGGGDPACDLAAAWLFFDATQRDGFRQHLGHAAPHDAATWDRARGWVVAMASAYLLNSSDAPELHAIGVHAVEQLLAE